MGSKRQDKVDMKEQFACKSERWLRVNVGFYTVHKYRDPFPDSRNLAIYTFRERRRPILIYTSLHILSQRTQRNRSYQHSAARVPSGSCGIQ